MSRACGGDKGSSDVPRRLPRGRHGLSRAVVVASQRERILTALVDVMVESGYTATSVADIIKCAGVSRETFYEQFHSKEDCFEQCFNWAMAETDRTIRQAVITCETDDPCTHIDRVFGAYLEALADEPARTKVFLVEVFAAGPRFSLMRVERHMSFVGVLAAVFGAQTDQQRFACQMLVATVSAMVTSAVAAGDFERVVGLREPLMTMIRSSRDLYGVAAGTESDGRHGSD